MIERVRTRLWHHGLGAGLFYLVAGLGWMVAVVPPERSSRAALAAAEGAALGALLCIAVPLAVRRSGRLVHDATRWYRDGRPPDARERRAMAQLAWRQANIVALTGVIATATAMAVAIPFFPVERVGRLAAGGLVCVTGAWIAMLTIAERDLGPLFAAMVRSRTDAPPRFGIVVRLVLAWGQGAAVPLATLVMSPERLRLSGLQWSVLGLGLAVSLVLIVFTGRSISAPLRATWEALRRVDDGDLDVTLDAHDAGEIGHLQVAFNEMVAGLRERRRIEDVFGRHVGVDVASRALGLPAMLGGETCEVSVLFVDVIGSTGLSIALPPDEVIVVLNAFFHAVVDVVHEEGGLVNKFEGDAALCVFGAPRPIESHREVALRAARVLRARLVELGPSCRGLDAAIGVSCGEVVAGDVGAADRYEYTVVGDPVNEAARLSDVAKTNHRVLAAARLFDRPTQESVYWRCVGPVALRGRPEPTTSFTLRA